jgi:hypothetical protein
VSGLLDPMVVCPAFAAVLAFLIGRYASPPLAAWTGGGWRLGLSVMALGAATVALCTWLAVRLFRLLTPVVVPGRDAAAAARTGPVDPGQQVVDAMGAVVQTGFAIGGLILGAMVVMVASLATSIFGFGIGASVGLGREGQDSA